MKTSEAIGYGALGLALVSAAGGTVYFIRKDAADQKAREQERAIELARAQAQAAAAAAARAPASSAPAPRPKTSGIDLGKVVKDVGGALGDVKNLVSGFASLFKF